MFDHGRDRREVTPPSAEAYRTVLCALSAARGRLAHSLTLRYEYKASPSLSPANYC